MRSLRCSMSRYESALELAIAAHQGQVRKCRALPYVTHPVQVARILEECGYGPDTVIAGLLHDVVEDGGVKLKYLQAKFGDEVASLVGWCSETKKDHKGKPLPWQVRKEEQHRKLLEAPEHAVAIIVADSLHNVWSTIANVKEFGKLQVLAEFNGTAEEMVWNYRTKHALALSRLGPGVRSHRMLVALDAALDELAELLMPRA